MAKAQKHRISYKKTIPKTKYYKRQTYNSEKIAGNNNSPPLTTDLGGNGNQHEVASSPLYQEQQNSQT